MHLYQYNLAQYKIIRNLVRKESRALKKKSQKDVANSCKQNPKKFWKYINSNTKSYKSVANISVVDSAGNKKVFENDLDKANIFAGYFLKVYTLEPDGD